MPRRRPRQRGGAARRLSRPEPGAVASAAEDIEAQRGTARLRTTDTAASLECGSSSVKVEDGKITLTAAKIVLAGTYYLGGADAANPVAMEGTVDTAGNADVTNLATTGFTQVRGLLQWQ